MKFRKIWYSKDNLMHFMLKMHWHNIFNDFYHLADHVENFYYEFKVCFFLNFSIFFTVSKMLIHFPLV